MILSQSPVQHVYSPFKIAFMTGLSDPECCSLSKFQKHFMASLEVPERYKLYFNFPYIPCDGEENELLWKASVENVKQYLQCQKRSYQGLLRLHFESLASSCEQLIILAGSCGLEMLNVALSPHSKKKLKHVFAYGPVARHYPDYSCTLIQSPQDYVSRFYFPKVDMRINNRGHLDYLQNLEMLSLVQRKLRTYVQD